MPVKDSILTTEEAIRAIVDSGYNVSVFDDFSKEETADRLDALAEETGIRVVHLKDLTDHPSPNYRLVLLTARKEALEKGQHLVIVESDVVVSPDTLDRMLAEVKPGTGLVAAVTHDAAGQINFPYDYARKLQGQTVETRKRLSFCCTLLTEELLRSFDFGRLDPEKNWYDVFISHEAVRLGFRNLLMLGNPVVHKPHSSRPWKQLKYSNPIKYYLMKLLHGRDKI